MEHFWDSDVWRTLMIFAVLFGSLLIGNMLKKGIPFLRGSLIPTSVLGGTVLIIFAAIYKAVTGVVFFDSALFEGRGTATLEIITYHTLALGFIASTLKTSDNKMTRERATEVFNTGVTTVATYLIQGVCGMAITILAAKVLTDLLPAAGLLLPFGYGQGTGQAMNYGGIYEIEHGFAGGKSFGLTIAALGFLSASIGGVIHLNVMKKLGKVKIVKHEDELNKEQIESANEIPMQESIDKLTIQVALIATAYAMAYAAMVLLGNLLPGMRSTIYGFNFLLGVLCATLLKVIIKLLRRVGIVKKDYSNNFLLTRASNFFFDIMVVSGIAAIRLDVLEHYWGLMLILGAVGLAITYAYNRIVAATLFKSYREEQFLAMYGMLTGTVSTGVILLREIDGDFKTPAADNLIYQNFPAIVFGFPLMLLATLAPTKPLLVLVILIAFFLALNVILFRAQIFRRKKK